MRVVDESELFSAARVTAVASKSTDKVVKFVKTASDERCWPTFEVCVDSSRGNANDRVVDCDVCEYVEVVALHEDMARRRALAKFNYRGVVIDVLCVHPGKAVKVS